VTGSDLGWVSDLAGLFERLVVPILGYGAYILRDIRNQLRAMNGRLMKMEEWRELHHEQDERFHQETAARVTYLERRHHPGKGNTP
jgi:TolA-binding protein